MRHPLFATLAGLVLAAGLARATPEDTPQDVANRYFAATTEAGILASLDDWLPDATITVTLKYGGGLPDEEYVFTADTWDDQEDWSDDPAMEGYSETGRVARVVTVQKTETGARVTSEQAVSYLMQGYAGQMREIETLHLVERRTGLKIQAVHTTYDYR